ncbi:hypothetical protein SRHO_G00185020 [Serrasalmus rhombeus]
MAIPFVLFSATANEDKVLDTFVALYARALHATLNGACLKQQARQALKSPALNAWDTCQHCIHKAERFLNSSEERLKVHQKAVEALGLACYTKGENCRGLYWGPGLDMLVKPFLKTGRMA